MLLCESTFKPKKLKSSRVNPINTIGPRNKIIYVQAKGSRLEPQASIIRFYLFSLGFIDCLLTYEEAHFMKASN